MRYSQHFLKSEEYNKKRSTFVHAKGGVMSARDCSLDESKIVIGVQTLLYSVRKLGFHKAKNIGLIDGISIEEEFALRTEIFLKDLQFSPKQASRSPQFTLSLKDQRVRLRSTVYLEKLLRKKRKPIQRHVTVSRELVDETTLLLASALLVRGFRGVRFREPLFSLKREVGWLLRSFGYRLAPEKVLACPMITEWYEYPLWQKLCLIDGGTKMEIDFALERGRGRSMENGCAGYPGRCTVHQVVLLPMTA